MKKQLFQKPLALLLTLVLILSLLPVSAFAADGDITVYVTVQNLTYTDNNAAWKGTPLDCVSVAVSPGSAMLTAITKALGSAGIAYSESGGYISSINGLAERAANDSSGWTATLNGITPGVGLGSVYLKENDRICVQYVTDWNALTWGTANSVSTGFSFSAGVFSYQTGTWSTALTLTLPADAASVQVTAVPNPDSKTVRIYCNGILTGGLSTANNSVNISVSDGDVLQIVLGSYEAVYDVAVRIVDSTAEIIGASGELLKTNIAAGYVLDVSDYWHILGVQAAGSASYSEPLKQAYVNTAVPELVSATASSGAVTLAMDILALRALGYDPAQLKNIYGVTANGYEKLAAATFSGVEGNAYALIALLHSGVADYDTRIDAAISALVEGQEEDGHWPDSWGMGYYADTTASALLALSLAHAENDTDTAADGVITKAVNYLKSQILADGTVPGDHNGSAGNANTTAMTAMALKAAGEEPSVLTKSGGGNTLLQGLLLFATGDNTGFVYSNSSSNTLNDYATKQAFLGLTAATRPTGVYNCFDFTANTSHTAAAAVAVGSPVTFSGTPADASVEVSLAGTVQTPVSDGHYDLPAGEYSYTASKSGYVTGTGSFTVSTDEAANHTAKSVAFTLTADASAQYIGVTVTGPTGTLYSSQSMAWVGGMTPLSALYNTGLANLETSGGYVSSVMHFGEGDYGGNSGWLYSVNGVTPTSMAAGDFLLSAGDTVLWYYTMDYTADASSSAWTKKQNASDTVAPTAAVTNGIASAAVTADELSGAAEAAKENGASAITIAPAIAGDASAVRVTVPASAVRELAADTGVPILIHTPNGSVELGNGALASIAEQAGGSDIEIAVETKSAADVDLPVEDLQNSLIVAVSILSGGESIRQFGGNELNISLPVDDGYTEGETYKVIVVGVNGSTETLWGKVTVKDGKTAVNVAVTHLSTFIVTRKTAGTFSDVEGDAWYAAAVKYASANGLFQGTSGGLFSPDEDMTRAMLAVVLYRLEGSPPVTAANTFADVENGAWYTEAVIWAGERGIVSGAGDGNYGVSSPVTRQEMAVMLCRFAAYQGCDVEKTADLTAYEDADVIPDWASEAMAWANAGGLITGVTGTVLAPGGNATRATAATVLMRFADSLTRR